MKNQTYISRGKKPYQQYQFRCIIPKDLENTFSTKEFRISLKSSLYSHSKIISTNLYNISQFIFGEVRGGYMKDITIEDVKNILRRKVNQTLKHIHLYERDTNKWNENELKERIDKIDEKEKKLKDRLKTDYIDLYQLHWPERNTNFFGKLDYKHEKEEREWNSIESVLKVLKQFIDQGKIRYVGLSNESAWGLSKFLEISKSYNLPRVMSVQNPYNLLNRTYEVGLAEISIREKSGLLAYSPMAFGVLSGKYRNNQKPKGSRLQLFGDMFPRYVGKLPLLAVEEYFKVAKKHKISLAQLSLAFVNQQPFVTSNIIGATTMKQLKEDIDSINVELNPEIIDEINLVHKNNPNPAP